MTVATKRGDNGTSGFLSGERFKKNHANFSVIGDIDELSSFLGLAKSVSKEEKEILSRIQLVLINYMSELAYLKDDFLSKGFGSVTEEDLKFIDDIVIELQNDPKLEQKGWVLYGKTELGATLDVSSKICRRVERGVVGLSKVRPLLLQYINRLSDLLYLLARRADLCQN